MLKIPMRFLIAISVGLRVVAPDVSAAASVLAILLIALFCNGHCILEGVPGLAKTMMVSTLSKLLSLSFSRIQFTPDLMPSDITGTEVIEEDRGTGSRSLRFVKGPIFVNVFLVHARGANEPHRVADHVVGAGNTANDVLKFDDLVRG